MTDGQRQQQINDSEQRETPRGYLDGPTDEVERLREQYIDGEIDEEQLAEQLTEQRLREHQRYKRRRRRAKRHWRLIGIGVAVFVVLVYFWSVPSGVPI